MQSGPRQLNIPGLRFLGSLSESVKDIQGIGPVGHIEHPKCSTLFTHPDLIDTLAYRPHGLPVAGRFTLLQKIQPKTDGSSRIQRERLEIPE